MALVKYISTIMKITTNLKTLPLSSSICRCQQQNRMPKIRPGHTQSFTVTNKGGRNQRYNYVPESCKAPQEGSGVCRRHCRQGAELPQWRNNTVQKSRYTPSRKMGPAQPCCCCLVYRGSSYTLPETHIYPQSLISYMKM